MITDSSPQALSRRKRVHSLTLVLLLAITVCPAAQVQPQKPVADLVVKGTHTILWQDGDVRSRNLFYGPGGEAHQPRGVMTFLKEDTTGSTPKFDVKDRDGTKWKVKLADEARPETAASRLLWAVGYFANEDYFVPELKVEQTPRKLKRGREYVDPDGTMHIVRLKRDLNDQKKIGQWRWKKNPFRNTREFDGLRVMMAVMNSWDLKDVNNAVVESKSSSTSQIYLVSDLGATFGSTGHSGPSQKSKGNLEEYRKSKFIRKITPELVDFNSPSRPALKYLFDMSSFIMRLRMRWISKGISREHAKWMGQQLAQLSPEQIRDAFRAAGYSPKEVEGFASVVEARIQQLNEL